MCTWSSKLLFILALVAFALPALSANDLTSCLTAVAARLDPRIAEVINRLDGTGRQLLAARSYLRSADDLVDRWSWSQQQPEVRSLDVQVETWNSNKSVAVAAEELLVAVTTFLASGSIAEASVADGCDSFANFLAVRRPVGET